MRRAKSLLHGVLLEAFKNGFSRRCIDIADGVREQGHEKVGATGYTGAGAKRPAEGSHARLFVNGIAGTDRHARANSTAGKTRSGPRHHC